MTIVDASVAVAWFVDIDRSHDARDIRGKSRLIAPAFLKVELTNALLKYARAKVISHDVIIPAIHGTSDLIREWWADEDILPSATRLAIAENHKIYDCLYLALAQRLGEPLATADRRLAELAGRVGVEARLLN